jgi:hypothetical protein
VLDVVQNDQEKAPKRLLYLMNPLESFIPFLSQASPFTVHKWQHTGLAALNYGTLL